MVGKTLVLSIIAAVILFRLPSTVSAFSFDPSFGVTLSDVTISSNSSVTGSIAQPSGDDLIRNVTFYVPPGWDISSGTSLDQDEVVGNGNFQVTLQPDIQ